jgi:uncharacterized repeat protein (TIGR03803 family)
LALLAGCSRGNIGSLPPAHASEGGALPAARSAAHLKFSYTFQGAPDGKKPFARLTNVNGTLYGTTADGGSSGCDCGTVFRVTPGTEAVVYSFKGGSDGSYPEAGLIDVNGVLYGTTSQGGASGFGTVFKVTTSGKETVLHTFQNGSDGVAPYGDLIEVNGAFYGTTMGGGGGGGSTCDGGLHCGTVYKITPSGVESVVYAFAGGLDGAYPQGRLLDVGGSLYGTTTGGGSTNCDGATGCGTVFKVTLSGAESVLHRFVGNTDGLFPRSGLTNVNGVFFGTTSSGGGGGHNGTVFTITPDGRESVLYAFVDGREGGPAASLIAVDGNGLLFSLTRSGFEKVIYTFQGGTAGSSPFADLIDLNGTLYGTTSGGPGFNTNNGTVFGIAP